MKFEATNIKDILIFEPKVFEDSRGFFYESFLEKVFFEKVGAQPHFVQDNHSCSFRHVLRGLHYQIENPQGKIIRVIRGEVFDVAVDIRKNSPTFGQWVGILLSAENKRHVWIPPGFAHGFLTLSDTAEVLYKITDYYAPQHERCLLWNDPDLNIDWPLTAEPILSAKDMQGQPLAKAEVFP